MNQTIRTRFSHRENGPKINVTASNGQKMSVPYDHALDSVENHRAAVRAFLKRHGWANTWAGGEAPGGKGYIFVDTSAPGARL